MFTTRHSVNTQKRDEGLQKKSQSTSASACYAVHSLLYQLLFADGTTLSRDGNFFFRHAVEYGTDDRRTFVGRVLKRQTTFGDYIGQTHQYKLLRGTGM